MVIASCPTLLEGTRLYIRVDTVITQSQSDINWQMLELKKTRDNKTREDTQ
jgi:hypothetical protein